MITATATSLVLGLLGLLVAPAGPRLQEEEGPALDPERVEAAVDALKALSKSRAPEDRIKILGDHGEVRDREVVDLVSRAVDDRDPRVSRAALFELRRNEHPRALDRLHGHYRKNRDLRKDPERYVELIKGIGIKGSPNSVELLEKDALANAPREVIQARLYAFGNIRTKESVEVLMKLMRSTGNRRGEGNAHMADFQISLMLLTGRDFGRSKKDWLDWWNDQPRTFEVARKAPKLPQAMRRRWEQFWGLRRTYDRRTERSKRGDDPERD